MYPDAKGHKRKGASSQGFYKFARATFDQVWGLKPSVGAAGWAAMSKSIGGAGFDCAPSL
jgi:hypothetical protein